MQITLELKCPTCLSDSIKKNGFKLYGKQNYQWCNSGITGKILHLMVRRSGVRNIAEVERISMGKVLRTLSELTY